MGEQIPSYLQYGGNIIKNIINNLVYNHLSSQILFKKIIDEHSTTKYKF